MNEIGKTKADANSRGFEREVEAGLKSENRKYSQAGYELGQGLNDKETNEPVKQTSREQPDSPPFLNRTLDGHDGDAMDEKDGSAE
jgi:hypothetical protein